MTYRPIYGIHNTFSFIQNKKNSTEHFIRI